MVAILIDSASKKKIVPAQPGFWQNPRYSGFGILIGLLGVVAIAIAITSFIDRPDGGGTFEKCWNYGGRSDDTINC
ncbi:hypothetical protein [Mesorhizobium temperatum]|uniref:Uncharacterized protein n=1 Tax=Mesorhizobium temperatum TaxID=241416 RepID=A0A271LF99_9HYPH|nr:hypothetical protein [Mesorhizobium temperatum]PAQ06781.1 hypothetical protein CIT26_23600 [Mesorhizobium temperatum]